MTTATGAAEAADAPAAPAAEWRISLKPLVDVAAAGAGFIVLVELVGRAVIWARFNAIGLPATSALSLQSPEVRLANGAGALAVAIGLGLGAVAALAAVNSVLTPVGLEREGRLVLLAVLELILVAAVLAQPASWAQRFAAIGVGVAAGGLFWALAERTHVRQLVLATFLLITAVGGVLAFVRNSGAPARLQPATVFLKDGSVTTGAYISLSSDTVYIAPDSFNRTYGELTAIPRSEVKRIALSRPRDFEEAGRSSPRALLAGSRVKPPYGTVAPAIARYLAAQAGDPVWQYPPLSFLESAYYISRHPATFFGNERAPAVDPGRHVTLERLVTGAREYSGRPVLTEGVVLRSSQVPGGSDAPGARLVTLRGTRDAHMQAFCLRLGAQDVPVATTVSVEGVVVNAGTVAADMDRPVKGVFIQTAGNLCGV
jgi:hypothetical protein